MRSLMWFREHDLRCRDNTALYHASHHADDGLYAIFLISLEEWREHDMAPCRMDFILRHLPMLATELAELNTSFTILTVQKKADILTTLLKFSEENQIGKLFFNDVFEFNERKRDEQIEKRFLEKGISVYRYLDYIVLNPEDVRTQTGKYFTIFTPYKKAWFKCLHEKGGITVLPKPKKNKSIPNQPTQQILGLNTEKHLENIWPVGEKIAYQKLEKFIGNKLNNYHTKRDFPALDGTSTLSPYLTSGIISARQCLKEILVANNGNLDKGDQGALTWVSELIWREFYNYVLFAFPRVSQNRAFKLNAEKIAWRNNENDFNAWKNGETGIPIVDAAMMQLKQIGWMHNRCRMIVAMFLSKNLLINWQAGEKYFMQNLIDGDLAANNGGWQWAASTGTDAVPYFRIFNPLTQAKRFDPTNAYIKKYCPQAFTKDYPNPIVDIALSRTRAIKEFAKV